MTYKSEEEEEQEKEEKNINIIEEEGVARKITSPVTTFPFSVNLFNMPNLNRTAISRKSLRQSSTQLPVNFFILTPSLQVEIPPLPKHKRRRNDFVNYLHDDNSHKQS